MHTVERRDIHTPGYKCNGGIHMEGHTHGRDRQTHEIQPEKIDGDSSGIPLNESQGR